MTVSAPPRPPAPARTAPDDRPLEREEIEALVEALIEEARRETRRRHRKYWALAALAAFVGAVILILLDGGAASQTASPALSARSGAAGTPSSKIAFVHIVTLNRSKREYAYELDVMNANGSGKRRLARNPAIGPPVSWSPDGRKLAFASTVRGNDDEIFVINADGSGLRRLTRNAVADSGPAWSPDGQKIAWTSRGHGTGADVFVMNADGSDQQSLTPKPGNQGEPRWSPDGRAILFTGVPPGQPLWVGGSRSASGPYRDVYVMNADGSGQRNLTHTPEGGEFDPAWSPDGQYVAFSQLAGPPWGIRIVVMNADGSGEHAVTHKIVDTFVRWSPDGRRIAFWDDAIYVVNADGSGLRRLAQNAAFDAPSWSPDGRKLTFVRLRHPKKIRPATGTPPPPAWPAADLWVMNADGSGQRNLTHTPTTSDGWGATWGR